jgi:hypothetical protein
MERIVEENQVVAEMRKFFFLNITEVMRIPKFQSRFGSLEFLRENKGRGTMELCYPSPRDDGVAR